MYIAFIPMMAGFILTLIFAPIVLHLARKLHAEQSILGYVDNHKDKEGTPTMGGIMFLMPTMVVYFIFGGVQSKPMLVMLGAMLSFGLLGFLDDFIKVKCRHNEGLKAYQKLIGQLGIGVIVTIFAYTSSEIGSEIRMPISRNLVDFNWLYIPFTLFVFLATTNSVNLTDGIDGLATSTTMIYIATFVIILFFERSEIEGNSELMATNNANITLLMSLFGSLLVFYMLNSHKAKIFMGDTGSLALGGLVGAEAVFTKNTLLIPIIGIMYMITSISVIIQVLYFKISHGKRIFLMAPYHHHLQYKGLSESKIVAIYSVVTIIGGAVALVSIL